MAYKVAAASGSWSTAATWNSVTNTPTQHATTSIAITGTGVFSATYTAPSTSDQATGVMVHVTTVGTGTLVATLQEDLLGTSSWANTAATVSVSIGSSTANTWVWLKYTSAYTFATTGAGRYRVKLNTSGATGSNNVAADSGGSNFGYLATDNRTGAPASTDDIKLGGDGSLGSLTLTVDGSRTIGSGTLTGLAAARSLTKAIDVGKNSILSLDTSANSSLQIKGIVHVNSTGEWRQGTAASPVGSAFTNTVTWDMTSASATGDYGLAIGTAGKFVLQGTPKSSTSLWKASYVSGSGTTLSPLVVGSAVDWAVGDEIMITPTGAASETEYKFIKTKNSATSYVLADTAGGAESGLANTHTTDAFVINIERNVLWTSNSTTKAWYFVNLNNTAGNVDIDWARFRYTGSGVGGREGFLGQGGASADVALDYSVFSDGILSNFLRLDTSKVATTFNGLVFCRQLTGATNGVFQATANSNNKTFNDCFFVDNRRAGVTIAAYNYAFNRCYFIANNRNNTATTGGFHGAGAGLVVVSNCDFVMNGVQNVYSSPFTDTTFFTCRFSPYGTNNISIFTVTDTYNTLTFQNCSFADSTLVSNYLNAVSGTLIRFHKYQQTDNKHRWYTNRGEAQSTGAGLEDTTIRTPGSLGVRLAPEDASDGFTWSFLVPAKAMSIVPFVGWFQKNAAFGSSTATISMYLPGSTTPDATATLTNDTGSWQAVSMSAVSNSSTDGLAEIRVVGITTTAAAYLYADDFFNSGDTITNSDKVTGLDTWYNGQPAAIISPQATSAADIWNFPTTNLTTLGTTGKMLKDIDGNAELAAVK